jgi:hypothetical protein
MLRKVWRYKDIKIRIPKLVREIEIERERKREIERGEGREICIEICICNRARCVSVKSVLRLVASF